LAHVGPEEKGGQIKFLQAAEKGDRVRQKKGSMTSTSWSFEGNEIATDGG